MMTHQEAGVIYEAGEETPERARCSRPPTCRHPPPAPTHGLILTWADPVSTGSEFHASIPQSGEHARRGVL